MDAKQTQSARAYLYKRHKHGFRIPPAKLAASAHELGTNFHGLMRFISLMYSRGQNQSLTRQSEIQQIAQPQGS